MDRIIETAYDMKPGPERQWDWAATFEDYEPGDLIGYGRTEGAAIESLLEQQAEYEACRMEQEREYHALDHQRGLGS